jgi:hypothetical protein
MGESEEHREITWGCIAAVRLRSTSGASSTSGRAAVPPATRFLRELEDHLSEEEAERVLKTVINWGRHAEIFTYDYDTEVLSLENF